jgi:hypothetical protein
MQSVAYKYNILNRICFVIFSLNIFLLAIVLSVLRRYTDSDYPFCIFKLFLQLKDTIERTKQHYKHWGILFVEYLPLYSVTLTLTPCIGNKSRVIKRCSIHVAIFVIIVEANLCRIFFLVCFIYIYTLPL